MPPANHKNHLARSDGGVALLVVLMFILLLSAIVVEFSYETQVQASLTGHLVCVLFLFSLLKPPLPNGGGGYFCFCRLTKL